MQLSDQDREGLAFRVTMLERRTGAQVVTAVVARSDSYPEAPWAAFSLGTALSALAIATCSIVAQPWEGSFPVLTGMAVMLACGGIPALLAVYCEPVARLFTDRLRRRAEVGQHARALFFDRGLDRTRGRIGILLLVSAFEREVVLLSDDGYEGKVDAAHWQQLTQRVALLMRHRGAVAAVHAGLDGLEALLLMHGFHEAGAANELPNAIPSQELRS